MGLQGGQRPRPQGYLADASRFQLGQAGRGLGDMRMTELPWQWRLENLETWQQRRGGPDKEWRFYPGTVEPHLRLIQHPGREPYGAKLTDTFLSKEQCTWIISSMQAGYSNLLNGQEIVEVNQKAATEALWASCKS